MSLVDTRLRGKPIIVAIPFEPHNFDIDRVQALMEGLRPPQSNPDIYHSEDDWTEYACAVEDAAVEFYQTCAAESCDEELAGRRCTMREAVLHCLLGLGICCLESLPRRRGARFEDPCLYCGWNIDNSHFATMPGEEAKSNLHEMEKCWTTLQKQLMCHQEIVCLLRGRLITETIENVFKYDFLFCLVQ